MDDFYQQLYRLELLLDCSYQPHDLPDRVESPLEKSRKPRAAREAAMAPPHIIARCADATAAMSVPPIASIFGAMREGAGHDDLSLKIQASAAAGFRLLLRARCCSPALR